MDAGTERWTRAEQGLRSRLAANAELPEAEWHYFRARLERLRLPREGHLIREGERETRIGYVARGVFRIYCTREAREINLGFDCEDRFVSAYESFVTRAPSTVAIQALEDAELLTFDRETLRAAYARHACWERIGRLMAEEQTLRKTRKERELRCLSPEERYLRLHERGLPWLARVPQYHVASFLGITPETLSRIRARQ
jgi:CRP-like cAMP-binding protein